MQKKNENIFSILQIIPFELVAWKTNFYQEIILVIGSQYVNKQSQDFRYYCDRIIRTEVLSERPKHMTKLLPCRFQQLLDRLTCWLSISVLTQGFLDIKGATLFAVFNFVNTSATRLIFFLKCWKLHIDFRQLEKKSENLFRFLDNCIWIRCFKPSLLLRENLCHW